MNILKYLIKYIAIFFCLFVFNAHANSDINLCNKVEVNAGTKSSVKIIFQFDKQYPCGQYANGDWWVSPNTQEDSVQIIEISPKSGLGRNGYAVNPNNSKLQSFDSRGQFYDKNFKSQFPLAVNKPSSIIKVISTEEKDKCRPCLEFAAVLTVLKVPLQDSHLYFRPGYFGDDKQSFKLDTAKWQQILSEKKLNFKIDNAPDLKELQARFQHVQLEAVEGWGADALHPKLNLPNYGAKIATDNAVGILRFFLNDINLSNKQHLQALINYLQMSVDFYSLAKQGFVWNANGGHNNGRKLPLIVGATFIDEQLFAEAISKSVFSEDEQIYKSKVTGEVLYGTKCSDKQYWSSTLYRKGSRTCADPYGMIDGGGHEIGTAYQVCCTAKPWKYSALAVKVMGKKGLWNNDDFFTYVDRWVERGVIASPDSCAPYNNNPLDYGVKFGPISDGRCIAGTGRWTNAHGTKVDQGQYDSKFAEKMWDFFQKKQSSSKSKNINFD